MYGSKIKKMLSIQYRMHKKIMEFSWIELYDNKLVAHPSCAKQTLRCIPKVVANPHTAPPIIMVDISDTGVSHEELGTKFDKTSKANAFEVQIVIYRIRALLNSGLRQDQIGAITHYKPKSLN